MASGFDVPEFNYNHFTVANSGITVLKSAYGILHTICVNNTGGGSITAYDNTTNGTNTVCTIVPVTGSSLYMYDLHFNTGLTVTNSLAAGSVTLTWV